MKSIVFFRKSLFSMLFIYLMSACSSVDNNLSIGTDLYNSNQYKLKRIENLNLTAQVIIVDGRNKQSARMMWMQEKQNFNLNIVAPLGINILQANKKNDILTINSQNKVNVYNTAKEDVEFLGFNILKLKDVVTGAIDINLATVNKKGFLQSYNFGEFTATYQNFQYLQNVWLPTYVKISNNKQALIIKSMQWSFDE